MHYRPLGSTGLMVSEIGMGCNRLGEPNMPDGHWVDLVRKAVELGVTLFDTAELYLWGRSEELLGKATEGNRDVLIATKVSRIRETGEMDCSPARIIEHVESSLRRLRRDCIDIYQLHSPSLEQLKQYDWPEAMTKLKQEGKIRLVGTSITDAPSGQWLIEQELVDVLQVSYNMLRFEVGQGVFPLAKRHGVGILVRVPMAQGILTGKFRPGQKVPAGRRALHAGKRLPKLIERAELFKPLAEGREITLGQMALRYTISPSAVSAAIPGARTPEQLAQNVAASNGTGLSSEDLRQIERIQTQLN